MADTNQQQTRSGINYESERKTEKGGRGKVACPLYLVRSMGGLSTILSQSPEDRQASDERILGSGEFVESVLRESDALNNITTTTIDDVLKEVVVRSGISCEQILGASRSRSVSNARRQFFLRAHEEAGATITMLGRLTGRSHVAVKLAIDLAKSE